MKPSNLTYFSGQNQKYVLMQKAGFVAGVEYSGIASWDTCALFFSVWENMKPCME